MDNSRPYVDFYSKNNISPVSQDISSLERHFQIRESLYRTLGVLPGFVRGSKVIEFGPGGGYNSLYTHYLSPDKYTLVEANSVGIDQIYKLIPETVQGDVEVVNEFIEDYSSLEQYDLVICEGVISAQLKPKEFLKHVSSFVAPGGVLIITCMDYVSYLSEALRRFVSSLLVEKNKSVVDNTKLLVRVWQRHLNTLKGMTRSHEDWVQDNMIHPLYGPLLSISDSIETLQNEFCVYGASPAFFTDWRWFKVMHGDEICEINSIVLNCYEKKLHNFVDHRSLFSERSKMDNCELLNLSREIYEIAIDQDRSSPVNNLKQVIALVDEVGANLKVLDRKFESIFGDFNNGLNQLLAGRYLPNFGSFESFFGRGQQYLSFQRTIV